MPKKMLLLIFYRASDQKNKIVVDNASGGSFINLPYSIVSKVLYKVAILCWVWDIKDAEVAMGAPSLSFVRIDRKDKEKETNANMSKVMSCLTLLLELMLVKLVES